MQWFESSRECQLLAKPWLWDFSIVWVMNSCSAAPFFVTTGKIYGIGGGLGNSEHQQDTKGVFSPRYEPQAGPVMLSSPSVVVPRSL